MAGKRKCPICNKYLEYDITDVEHVVAYKKRYAHIDCFNNMVKFTSKAKKQEIAKEAAKKKTRKKSVVIIEDVKDGISEEDFRKRKAYFNKVKQLTGYENLDVKYYKVSEDYIKKYRCTYEEMHMTLIYYYDILGNNVHDDWVIGIIPYHLERSKRYFEKREAIEKNNEELLRDVKNINELYRMKTIRIRPRKKTIKQIDISEIGGDASE